jgi:glycosyltransferase involved in cell wall biosynthesis
MRMCNGSPRGASLSIIVPVLNEAEGLEAFLRHLRERAPGAELVVVDGGSKDGSAAAARSLAPELGLTVLEAPRGRAPQMNAGAAAASGELLWFLHADSRVPAGAADAIREALADPELAGGCFRLKIDCHSPIYRVSDTLGNLGVDRFQVALGDHGLFCRRKAFHAVGGYPLEVTSPRRYERHGPYRTTGIYLLILALYLLGCKPSTLYRLYRFVSR